MKKEDCGKEYIQQALLNKVTSMRYSFLCIAAGCMFFFGSVYISDFLRVPVEWPRAAGFYLSIYGLVSAVFNTAKRT